MMRTMMINPKLTLLQVCDSNFPTGAFSHSFGLETYIQEGRVCNRETLKEWLLVYIHEQCLYNDFLACSLIYDGYSYDEIDTYLFASSLARESREGTKKIGERMTYLLNDLAWVPELKEYEKKIKEKKLYGHPAIAYTLFCKNLNIEKDECMNTFLYSNISSIIQNAVRGIPLGQTDGQKILFQMQMEIDVCCEKVKTLTMNDLGYSTIGLELSSMKHEDLHVRLFMS